MEEQPISKPILILAIIIILVITIGAIVLITNLITPKESKVQAFDDSIHNELIQNTLISRSEQAINDIVSSEHMPIQSAEEINSNILLKNMIVYLKDSNDRFYGQTFNYSSYGRFNAVIFGYDFNDYCVFCYYPNDWEAGPYLASAGDKTYATIRCNSDISNPDLPSLFIYQMDISNYPNYSTDQYLGLLEQNVRQYQNDLGYGSVNNFNIENLTLESSTKRVLSYDFSLSQYYEYKLWSTIQVSGNYMYILTVSIPKDELNDENLEIRDVIIHTYNGSEVNY